MVKIATFWNSRAHIRFGHHPAGRINGQRSALLPNKQSWRHLRGKFRKFLHKARDWSTNDVRFRYIYHSIMHRSHWSSSFNLLVFPSWIWYKIIIWGRIVHDRTEISCVLFPGYPCISLNLLRVPMQCISPYPSFLPHTHIYISTCKYDSPSIK